MRGATKMTPRLSAVRVWLAAAALLALGGRVAAQGLEPAALLKPAVDSWPTYHGDYSGQRHSSLTQITPANVSQLTLAWAFQTGQGAQIKSTPILRRSSIGRGTICSGRTKSRPSPRGAATQSTTRIRLSRCLGVSLRKPFAAWLTRERRLASAGRSRRAAAPGIALTAVRQ